MQRVLPHDQPCRCKRRLLGCHVDEVVRIEPVQVAHRHAVPSAERGLQEPPVHTRLLHRRVRDEYDDVRGRLRS